MKKNITKTAKKFYDTFGLYKYVYLLKDRHYINNSKFEDRDKIITLFTYHKNKNKYDNRFVITKVEKQYFNITGEQWLKLICLHTIYTDLPFSAFTIEGLKNEIMKDLLEVYEDICVQKELYADIRKVFNLKS